MSEQTAAWRSAAGASPACGTKRTVSTVGTAYSSGAPARPATLAACRASIDAHTRLQRSSERQCGNTRRQWDGWNRTSKAGRHEQEKRADRKRKRARHKEPHILSALPSCATLDVAIGAALASPLSDLYAEGAQGFSHLAAPHLIRLPSTSSPRTLHTRRRTPSGAVCFRPSRCARRGCALTDVAEQRAPDGDVAEEHGRAEIACVLEAHTG